MLTLKPDHELFTNAEFKFPGAESVEVCLGANPACSRHLKGIGVPCILYPRFADGSIAGTGAHAGFVVELDLDELVEAGADEDKCWIASGANPGTHYDFDDDDDPVCLDCLRAGGTIWYEGQDPDNRKRDIENGDIRRVYPAIPEPHKEACWCCCVAISENWRDNAAHAEEQEAISQAMEDSAD